MASKHSFLEPRCSTRARRSQTTTYSQTLLRREEAQPEPFGQEPRDQLALDAVAALVERRGEGSKPAFAGGDGHDPTADAALARQPDVVEPVPRGFVQSSRRHHCQRELAAGCIDDPLPGERVDPAVGERRAHDGKILGAYVERTLPRIEIGRLGRIDGDPAKGLQEPGNRLVAMIGLCGGSAYFLVD